MSIRTAAALLAAAMALSVAASAKPWWQGAVIYEIYPRSFQDSNGDGVGDLNGITQRLDYIKSLGADAIWLTPIYPSPFVDFGYDISSYTAIDPQYGTLADFDRLVAEAKKRNIRVIMDLVLNHTSDKHPWFAESASSRTNPKRDWYVWRDPKGKDSAGNPLPPNNWQSVFGHSGWQYDAKTGQYYWHKFYAEQPDLNWRNPKVAQAMYDVERFWIARGVAGFRLDAITTLFEDPDLRDEGIIKDAAGKPVINAFGDPRLDDSRTNNLPEVHDILRQVRKTSDDASDKEAVLIGETYVADISDLKKMYGAKNDELQMPMDLQVGFINKLDVSRFRKLLNDAETGLGAHAPLLVLDNHDNPRWDRYGDGVHNEDIGRVLSAVILASRGAAMYYYGDEIGMVTSTPVRKEDVRDPVGVTGWPLEKGRDGERTPMQWDGGANAGFTAAGVKTWLPVPASASAVNVAAQEGKADTLLSWYRTLGALRKSNPALAQGDQVMLNPDDTHVLAFIRRTPKGEAVLVACNFTPDAQTVSFDLDSLHVRANTVSVLMNSPGQAQPASLKAIALKPYGVAVLELH
jgi:Glycosidases